MSKTLQKASGVVQQHLKIYKVDSLKQIRKKWGMAQDFCTVMLIEESLHFCYKSCNFWTDFYVFFSYIFPETSQTLTVSEDPNLLYELISSGTLKDAYMHGKLYSLSYFFYDGIISIANS